MSYQIPDEILMDALDRLEAGDPAESIIAAYPAHAEALRPFLQIATQLSALPEPPTPAVQAAAKHAFLAEASQMKAAPASARRPTLSTWRRLLTPLTALALLLFLFGAGLPAVSANALPGEFLYGPKRTVEQVRLSLTVGQSARNRLESRFNDRRLEEVAALLENGRSAQVAFEGIVETVDDSTLQIASLPVQLTAQSEIEGVLAPGARVAVLVQAENSVLTALRVTALEPGVPLPLPTPTVTPSPTLTTSPTEVPVIEPTATPTSTQTPTAVSSPTPTVVPTQTSTPVVPVDDGDDDDNQNENENGSDDQDDQNENELDDNENDGGNDDGGDDSNDNGNDDDANDNDDDDDDDNDGGDSDDDDDNDDNDDNDDSDSLGSGSSGSDDGDDGNSGSGSGDDDDDDDNDNDDNDDDGDDDDDEENG